LDEMQVLRACTALRDALRAAVAQGALKDLGAEVLGPAPAPVLKVNNRYRYRIYLVAQSCAVLRRMIAEYMLAFHRRRENRGLELYTDCNAQQ